MRDIEMFRCAIMRGGTSKGVFFLENDLPRDVNLREKIILAVFGSPDIRQIDGLGGATPLTSKAMIVGPSKREDADVESIFGQVSIATPLVDWGGNCGNLTSAIGPFAIEQGLVFAEEPETTVRIYNTNTKKLIIATVPVREGRALSEGDYAIPGVPGKGARIDLEFLDPSGSFSGRLLPTGKPKDVIVLNDGRSFTVSILDAANPVVFASARELGLEGTELPPQLEVRRDIMEVLEEVRSIAAEMIGIVPDRHLATRQSPGLPKVGFVAEPREYLTTTEKVVKPHEMDILARLFSMQTAHRSYMVTGAICTAAAAVVKGTLINELGTIAFREGEVTRVRIGHPYGVMDVSVKARFRTGEIYIESATVGRTARMIMDGWVRVPRKRLEG